MPRRSIQISSDTLRVLRMAQGVYQAVTGKKYSYDKTIKEMAASVVYTHAEVAGKAVKEAHGQG